MNIFSQLFANTGHPQNNKSHNRRFQDSLKNKQASNISLPAYSPTFDSVSFTSGINVEKTKVLHPKIQGKLNFFKSIFKFAPGEVEKIENFKQLLEFIRKENSSGDSINSVLTEALNKVAEQISPDDKMVDSIKAVKLVFGLDGNNAHDYNDIKKVMGFDGAYVLKIFQKRKFLNMIKENIPAEKAKRLSGVEGLHSQVEVNKIQTSKQFIKSKMDIFSSIFEIEQQEIEKVTDFEKLLAFVNREKSGDSINSVLTESVNKILKQVSGDEKLSKDIKAVKFLAGLDGEDMLSSEQVRGRLGYGNAVYVQSILKKPSIINMIIENIPAKKANGLIGINGLKPIIEVDSNQITKQFIESKMRFFSSVFEIDTVEIEKINDFDKLVTFMNRENISGDSIKSVLTEAVNKIDEQNPGDETLSNFTKAVKLTVDLDRENIPSYNKIKETLGDVQNIYGLLFSKPERINMIKENIPVEKAENLIGVKRLQPVIERDITQRMNLSIRVDLLTRILRFDVFNKDINEVIKSPEDLFKLMNITNSSGKTVKQVLFDAVEATTLHSEDKDLLNFCNAIKGLFSLECDIMPSYQEIKREFNIKRSKDFVNKSNSEILKKLANNISEERRSFSLVNSFDCSAIKSFKNIEPKKEVIKEQKPKSTLPKNKLKKVRTEAKKAKKVLPKADIMAAKPKEILPKSDTPLVTTKALVPYFPIIPKLNPNAKIDEINLCLPEKYKINRYIQSDDRLREHVINNIRPEVARIMKEIKAEYSLGIIKDKDIKIILNIIMQKFGINVEKKLYSDTEIYNMLVSSGIKISNTKFKSLVKRVYNLLHSKMGVAQPPELSFLKTHLRYYIDNINNCLPLKNRVRKDVSSNNFEIFVRHIRPRVIKALKKFDKEDDPDIEILRKIIELRFGIGNNKLNSDNEISSKLNKLGYNITTYSKFASFNKRANELLIQKLAQSSNS